jgi:hypothetical protein
MENNIEAVKYEDITSTKFPFLEKGFFSEDEIKQWNSHMKSILETKKWVMLSDVTREDIETNMLNPVVDYFLSRLQCSLPPETVPPELLRKPLEEAKKINPYAKIRFISFVRYSNDFGIPQLGPHLDPPSQEHFFFDVQLDGNIDWPIVVAELDGTITDYSLENNDSLCIEITRQTHWRKPTVFKDGDFVDMLFVSFEDSRIEPPTLEWQTEVGLKYMKNYEFELDEVYPNIALKNPQDNEKVVRARLIDKIYVPERNKSENTERVQHEVAFLDQKNQK